MCGEHELVWGLETEAGGGGAVGRRGNGRWEMWEKGDERGRIGGRSFIMHGKREVKRDVHIRKRLSNLGASEMICWRERKCVSVRGEIGAYFDVLRSMNDN